MNETIHCSRTISAWGWKVCAALGLMIGNAPESVWAQPPHQLAPVYAESSGSHPAAYGHGPHVQLPSRPQYYEYLPPDRFGPENVESPLDRLLKQAIRQTYGRLDYIHWNYSSPGAGVIGGPGKKLTDGEGFQTPAYIDPVRGPEMFDFGGIYPIRSPLLKDYPHSLVLIQTWEANPSDLIDLDGNGNIWDLDDADGDGINDDTNDIDVFPRITSNAKSDMLNGRDPGIMFSTGDPLANPIDPAQVAILAVGQLANSNAFNLNGANGFRGIVGLNTSFGALETNFIFADRATSSWQYQPIPSGFLGVPSTGAGGNQAVDPLVIPILVNGQMAPNVYDTNGNTVTDSNNYYLIFNDSYAMRFHSQAWGFTPTVLLNLYERPDRIRLSSTMGFRYFDYREGLYQRGTFSNDPAVADFTYDNELGNADLTSTINSTTINRIYGPQAGIRAEIGDERFSLGLDANIMLGANTSQGAVSVDDLLYAGDDNYTKQSSTNFATGFELLADAKVRVSKHVSFTVGYNLLWFNNVTRPHENIYYNIAAEQDPASENFTYANDVRVSKKKSSIDMSGVSVGILVDW